MAFLNFLLEDITLSICISPPTLTKTLVGLVVVPYRELQRFIKDAWSVVTSFSAREVFSTLLAPPAVELYLMAFASREWLQTLMIGHLPVTFLLAYFRLLIPKFYPRDFTVDEVTTQLIAFMFFEMGSYLLIVFGGKIFPVSPQKLPGIYRNYQFVISRTLGSFEFITFLRFHRIYFRLAGLFPGYSRERPPAYIEAPPLAVEAPLDDEAPPPYSPPRRAMRRDTILRCQNVA